MLFRGRRRAVCVTLCITAALSCFTASVSADSWFEQRYNGEACNRYFLTSSVINRRDHYAQAFRDAITQWQGISSKVDRGMFERSSWIAGNDKCFVGLGTQETRSGVLGITRYYERLSNGRVEEIGEVLESRQGPKRMVDQRWFMSTVSLYADRIRRSAQRHGNGDDDYEMQLQTTCAIHEIGHSLKLAHPTPQGETLLNQGTFRNNIIVPSGQKSVMFSGKYLLRGALSTQPETYDRQELQAKWGM